jgi:F5/8 type C domain
VAAVAAFALSPSVHTALGQARPLGFYVAAGAVMWWCALGPAPAVFGQASELPGPFTLLTQLPGFASLRVPARFWLATTLCLSVVVAFAVAELSRRLHGVTRAVALCVLSLGVLSDGWEMRLPFGAVPAGPPNPGALRGARVLYLPAGSYRDVVPTYYSVAQGWTAVNGYSGFEPTHYDGVRQGAKLELEGVFTFFRSTADLHVVVAEDAPRLQALVERQPGVVTTGRSAEARQYRLPQQAPTSHAPFGDARPVTRATSSCPPAPILVDGGLDDIWTCSPQLGNESITLTLGGPVEVAGVRLTLGRIVEFPRQLVVETSLDGAGWDTARSGDVVSEFIRAAHARPTQPSIDVPFPPRVAAFVRLRQVGQDPASAWSMREVQVLGPAAGSR